MWMRRLWMLRRRCHEWVPTIMIWIMYVAPFVIIEVNNILRLCNRWWLEISVLIGNFVVPAPILLLCLGTLFREMWLSVFRCSASVSFVNWVFGAALNRNNNILCKVSILILWTYTSTKTFKSTSHFSGKSSGLDPEH